MYELETESEDELFNMSRPQEDTNLLRVRGKGEKMSGKAWGRFGKFICCQEDYPKSVFFIVGNEFCERFSFYGMRAVLVLYLTKWLMISENTSTAIYHGFTMVCYFSPLFGAMIADGWLGKYRTILYVSILYAIGNATMALTALPPPELIGPLVGLILIGLGTGGIKPCVAAFGGDQFAADQEHQLQQFFSIFYFSINAGSLLSTLLTPVIRAEVQCFGTTCPKSCYPLAFGIPAILMVISLVLFISGRNTYKKYPATGNIIGKFFQCIGRALKNRCGRKDQVEERTRAHWLEYADDKFSESFIEDVRRVLHVLVLFIPLPVFWALFDQQGSRWTLQATKMDLSMGSLGNMKPDQMQALNPMLILVFIPVFENVVYPLLDKCKIPNRPLQRMCAGMVLAATAFIIAGFLQLRLEATHSRVPHAGYADVRFLNTVPCQINIQSQLMNKTLQPTEITEQMRVISTDYNIKFAISDPNCTAQGQTQFTAGLSSRSEFLISAIAGGNSLTNMVYNYSTEPSKPHISTVSVVLAASPQHPVTNVSLVYDGCERYNFSLEKFTGSPMVHLKPATYHIQVQQNETHFIKVSRDMELLPRAMYTIVMMKNSENEWVAESYKDRAAGSISIFAQVPQYVLITAGEIMFSITGLSFSYSQAPACMKSVVQAFWLMTVAVGNLIVVIVAESRVIHNQAVEFFLFAALMGLVSVIFAIMAMRYKYVTPQPEFEVSETLDTNDLINREEQPDTMPEIPTDKST